MRDEKELAEELIEQKPRYEKYLHSADVNVKDKFNSVMISYARREPGAAEMLAALAGEQGNIFSIGLGILKNPAGNSIAVSPYLIAQAMLMLAFQLEWREMVQKIIKEGYDRKNGYPVALIPAFITAMEKGRYENVRKAVAETFGEGMGEEACALLAGIGEKKLALDFRKELIENAAEGEGATKMNALAALSSAVFDDSQIKATFVSLLDDWDDDARGFCAGVLAKETDRDVALRALELLPDEHDARVKFHLLAILENNREFAVSALMDKLAKAKDEKEAEKILALLVKIEKTEKIKGLLGKIGNTVGEGVKKAIDKFFLTRKI